MVLRQNYDSLPKLWSFPINFRKYGAGRRRVDRWQRKQESSSKNRGNLAQFHQFWQQKHEPNMQKFIFFQKKQAWVKNYDPNGRAARGTLNDGGVCAMAKNIPIII